MTSDKILELFLFNKRLKFNEIEKLAKIRSNKLDYYLKKLMQKSIIIKEGSYYQLSESSEYLIPYISNKRAALPVILIKIGKGKNFFLFKREKRPYKGKFSLPGGRILLGEDLADSAQRIMKEKFSVEVRLKKIDSVSIEHIVKNKKIIHTFLLILVSAETKQKIPLINITRKKKEIISSDYKLITSKDLPVRINKIISKDD
ncbi:MAG: NUDIX domain-containing protein [Candidatus Nanoarchaeia archaeon]